MRTLIVNANVITGDGKTILEGRSIVLEGELIDGISQNAWPMYDRAGRIIDAGGGYVIPGFINHHTHCVVMGPPAADLVFHTLPKSRVIQNLNRHLLEGTTTVVNLDGFPTMEELEETRSLTPMLVQRMSLHLPLFLKKAKLLNFGEMREEHYRPTIEDMIEQGALGIGEVGGSGILIPEEGQPPDISYWDVWILPWMVRDMTGVVISTEEARALRMALLAQPPDEEALSDLMRKMGISAAKKRLKEWAERIIQYAWLTIQACEEAVTVAGKLGVPLDFHSAPQTKSLVLEAARKLKGLLLASHCNIYYDHEPSKAIEVASAIKKAGGRTDITTGNYFRSGQITRNHVVTLALLEEGLVDMISTDYMGGYWDSIPQFIQYAVNQKVIDVPQAIRMATQNVVEAIPNVAPNRGQISEGKIADLAILSRKSISQVRTVLIGGKVVVDEGRIVYSPNEGKSKTDWG